MGILTEETFFGSEMRLLSYLVLTVTGTYGATGRCLTISETGGTDTDTVFYELDFDVWANEAGTRVLKRNYGEKNFDGCTAVDNVAESNCYPGRRWAIIPWADIATGKTNINIWAKKGKSSAVYQCPLDNIECASEGDRMKYWDNTDFPGSDKIIHNNIASIDACAKLCLDSATCDVLTYKKDGGRCWLKKTTVLSSYKANPLTGYISGMRCNANFPPEPTTTILGFYPHLDPCMIDGSKLNAGYRGDLAVTVSGKTCQAWGTDSPHANTKKPADYPSEGLVANYCRASESDKYAWCYTTDPNKRWEPCACVNAYVETCTDFGDCSASCGSGTKTCQNTCIGGYWGGYGCPKDQRVNTQTCNPQLCPKVTECTIFDACSVTCGAGTQSCTNTCEWGSWGDAGCDLKDKVRTRSCNPETCPSVTDCTDFGDCPVTCGGATQTCTSKCNWGSWGDIGCELSKKERTKECNPQNCPVVESCEDFTACDATCGGGRKTCNRKCNWGTWGDLGCDVASKVRSESCNGQTCPSVTACTDYGQCSKTCGGGTQTCTSTCNWGSWGDIGCDNKDRIRTKACNDQTCPKWTEWVNWSPCSVTCDLGERTRSRECKLGNEAKEGECTGDTNEQASQTKTCNLELCVYTLGVAIPTTIEYNEDLFDKESELFKKKSVEVANTVKVFARYEQLEWIEIDRIAVTEFFARKADRKRRSADPGVDASVDFVIGEQKSLAKEGTKSAVHEKLVQETNSATDESGNSLFSDDDASIDRCNEAGFTSGNNCPENSLCNRQPLTYFCTCNAGHRMVTVKDEKNVESEQCNLACDLFGVECSVNGWTITVKEDCRAEQYGHLKESGLFAHANDLSATFGAKPDDLDAKCVFTKPTGETEFKATFGFDTCGVSPFSVEDGNTVFTTYINHQVKMGDIVTSQMDQNELQCKLENVNLETEEDLSDNDELLGDSEIDAPTLVKDFSLKLLAGTVQNDVFTSIAADEKVDVGEKINIKLDFKDTTTNNYQFALSDCAVETGGKTIELYTKFCPKEEASIVDLDWLKSTEYSLNAFRVADAASLTFKCTASVYPQGANLCDCDKNTNCDSRRRRSAEGALSAEVATTIKLNADDKQNDAKFYSMGAFGVCLLNYY